MLLTDLLRGRLLTPDISWPLHFFAMLCDLRPRFLVKERVGRGYRAIARNGRVLLVSDLPLEELAGRVVRARLQVWHRAILGGVTPEPYGLLLCVRNEPELAGRPLYQARLTRFPKANADLVLDVGGRQTLEFTIKTATST